MWPVHPFAFGMAERAAGGMRPIELPGGFLAPSFGSARISTPDRKANVLLWFAYINGRFEVVAFELFAVTPDGYTADTLNLREALDSAVALSTKPPMPLDEWWASPYGQAERIEDYHQGALTAVQTMRRRRTLTPDFLAEVLELYGQGGTAAVQAKYPADERTVRRWLALARKRAKPKAKRLDEKEGA